MLKRLAALMKEHHLDGTVELAGSFCMERCGEGMNWQIGDEKITSRTVDEAVETFKARVLGDASRD